MKSIIIAAITFVIIASSCSTARNAYIGMSETEFRKKVRAAMIESSRTRTVYVRQTQSPAMYYYFENGILVEINTGTRNPDIIIENRRN